MPSPHIPCDSAARSPVYKLSVHTEVCYRAFQLAFPACSMRFGCAVSRAGGDERVRTDDPLLAKQVLSQLSYTPMSFPSAALLFLARSALLVGSSGLEPPTSRLSGVRSNHLSYEPSSPPAPGTLKIKQRVSGPLTLEVLRFLSSLLRKEVIQPHLPIRLPCYDFTPIANPTFGSVLLAVRLPTSGITGSHGVTGGVYKARERIHRGMLIRDY